eukprot:363181-Chlamydomonas_euryale.AAC.3
MSGAASASRPAACSSPASSLTTMRVPGCSGPAAASACSSALRYAASAPTASPETCSRRATLT